MDEAIFNFDFNISFVNFFLLIQNVFTGRNRKHETESSKITNTKSEKIQHISDAEVRNLIKIS